AAEGCLLIAVRPAAETLPHVLRPAEEGAQRPQAVWRGKGLHQLRFAGVEHRRQELDGDLAAARLEDGHRRTGEVGCQRRSEAAMSRRVHPGGDGPVSRGAAVRVRIVEYPHDVLVTEQ